MIARALGVVALAAGCGRGQPAAPLPPPGDAAAPPGPREVAIPLTTDDGLSGLAVAADGALWTVAERSRAAFRVVLDGDRAGAIERHPIRGLPDGVDVEGLDAAPGGALVLGTEAHDAGAAGVWRAAPAADGGLDATPWPGVDLGALGLALDANHGVEGVCAIDGGATVVAAIESVEARDGARLAPVIVARDGAAAIAHRVRLTSATGKLSALDCAAAPDGAGPIDVWAIERHFEVTRVIAFRLPRDAGADAPPVVIEPRLVVDLAPVAAGRNFEGLARLPDGRLALVVDNQWKTIEGPSLLVLVTPP